MKTLFQKNKQNLALNLMATRLFTKFNSAQQLLTPCVSNYNIKSTKKFFFSHLFNFNHLRCLKKKIIHGKHIFTFTSQFT